MSQNQMPWQKVFSADEGFCTLQVRAFAAITCHLLPVLLPGSEPTGSGGFLDRTSCPSAIMKTLTLFCSQRSAGGSRDSLLFPASTNFQPSPSEESPLPNLVSTDSYCLSFHCGWGFRLLYLHALRQDPVSLFLMPLMLQSLPASFISSFTC